MRITISGAESTGKSALARGLAERLDGLYVPEFARDYLINEGSPAISIPHMYAIWHGQWALQNSLEVHIAQSAGHDIVQDTDLFDTFAYWAHWDVGSIAPFLLGDADSGASDLYFITRSNIPFEADSIRYGGDKRETEDDFWIDIHEAYGFTYRVLDSADREARIVEAESHIIEWKKENPE